MFVSLVCEIHEGYAQEKAEPPMNIVVSLDNSSYFLAALGLIIGVSAIVYIRKSKNESDQDKVIRAYLLDVKNATGKGTYEINKAVTTIGRTKWNGVDICIAMNTMSTTHAQIEYRNGNFYLRDLRSRNGTYLNGSEERISSEVCLKNGDIITFDQYNFKFVVPGQGERGEKRKELQSRTILRVNG